MSIFKGLNEKKARVNSDYDMPGIYWQRINAAKQGADRNSIPMVIINKTVIKVFDDDEQKGHRLGAEVGTVYKAGDYFAQSVKDFLAATTGASDEENNSEFADECFGKDNPLQGIVVEMRNGKKPGKKPGTMFTRAKYVRAVPYEEVKETLTEAELEKFYPDGLIDKLINDEA